MGIQLSDAQASFSEGSLAENGVQSEMAAAPEQVTGRILYVTTDGAGTLCSIEQPCDLQTAADESEDGDEIRVAAGVYNDFAVTGSTTQTLRLVTSVLIEGGYTSTNWTADPDPVANETILDGNDQVRVVLILGPISPTIRGFSIRSGQAVQGAGIYQPDANGNAVIKNNRIFNNTASGPGSQGGGGVYIGGGSVIVGNEIFDNSTTGSGGGIFISNNLGGNAATVEDNEIYGNFTTAPSVVGGGIFVGGTGTDAVISRNEIYQNSSNFGGGIGVFVNSGALIENNMIHNNTAVGTDAGGGGLALGGVSTLWHNTIAVNSAGTNGGGIYVFDSTTEIINSIIANNTGGTNSGIHVAFGSAAGSFNNVFNNGSNATLTDPIAGDPMFVNPGGNDFHLTTGSPDINTGDDSFDVNIDFDGQGRPFDGGIEVGADEY
ncbi:MAG: right-handed parallel beta-helix repeat-containing protein, partial [Candidatus Promineifilaceae bacterium]